MLLRKVLIVVALFWAMAQLGSFSALHDGDASSAISMVAFGFIILAAYTLGKLAERIHLPHITGYLLAGVACGPHFLGLLDARTVSELKLFDTLAIALIAMEAGSALDLGGLQKRWRQVAVLTTGLIVLSLAGGLAFAGLTSGVVPPIAIPWLAEGGSSLWISVGLLLGVVIMATSPPVTLAVVSEARAKGSFTDTILTSVIINNVQVVVLFAVAMGVTHALLGSTAGHGGAGGPGAVLAQLGWSLVLGGITAGLAAAAMRFLANDAMLAVIGLCFVFSYVASGVDASPLLTFLTAGALLNIATRQGPAFKRVASRLSGPVYVLFFTLVGADLHIDALQVMAPFALAIVLIRLAAYATAIRISGRIVELPDTVQRFGALGLAPQAGIALTVALAVGHEFEGWGMSFETLGLAAIALNEMVGPVLLKWSLSLAGEARADEKAEAQEAAKAAAAPSTGAATAAGGAAGDEPMPPQRISEWLPDPGRPDHDPWGGAPGTGERRIDELARELQRDLDALVRDLRSGVIARRREAGLSFVQLLRKEFLRTHRRTMVKAADTALSDTALLSALARERGELAGRWKSLLLDRAATIDFRAEHQATEALLAGVDRLCQNLPAALTTKVKDQQVAPHPDDTRMVALRRRAARVRRSVGGLVGDEPLRVIEARAIARYVMIGRLPVLLRDAVGMLVLEERFLLARTRNLFDVFDHALDEVLEQSLALPDDADPDVHLQHRQELLTKLRDELEEELRLMAEAVDRFADESVRVTASALGRAYRELVEKLAIAGTPALVPRDYRFSRIYEHSQRAMVDLFSGLDNAREYTRGTAAALAMELDVVRLTEQVRGETTRVAALTGRDVRGRMTWQLSRVQEAMDTAVVEVGSLLRESSDDPEALLADIEEALAPLNKVVDEVVGIAQQFRSTISTQTPFEQLMTTLTHAVDGLTDRFQVIFDGSGPVGRGIPPASHPVDLPFRDLVRSFVESETGRELSDLAARLQQEVDGFARGIEDIDRMLVFHTELARAELEARESGPIRRESLEVLEESLGGTLRRLARRATELQHGTEELAVEVEQGVKDAVLGNLDRLRNMLLSGHVGEIRSRLTQRTLAQGRRELRSAATRAAGLMGQVVHVVRATLGEDALYEARKIVGLPEIDPDHAPGPEDFATPAERVEIPIAYRRLFSDRALEAGDMLVGREDEVGRLREVLLGRGPGASRAVAIVGVGGMGQGAVMQAMVRGLSERAKVHRFELGPPGLDEAQVDEMFQLARQATTHQRATIIVVDGFRWLFDIRPHGFDLLRRFIAGVVETSGRVGWLLAAERPVWAYADRAVPLHDAFPERMDLEPLDPQGLRRAILARHAMSGYQLEFRRPDDNLAWWLREVLSPRALERRLYEEHYFRALHKDSGGVLRDALHLWMASIAAIDAGSDTVWVGTPPAPPIRPLRELPDDLVITLRQVARSGRITPVNHAIQFQVPVEMSRALLTRLTHWGLLQREEDDSFSFRAEMAGAIYRVLRERRLVG